PTHRRQAAGRRPAFGFFSEAVQAHIEGLQRASRPHLPFPTRSVGKVAVLRQAQDDGPDGEPPVLYFRSREGPLRPLHPELVEGRGTSPRCAWGGEDAGGILRQAQGRLPALRVRCFLLVPRSRRIATG